MKVKEKMHEADRERERRRRNREPGALKNIVV
jgi:hypothetical protein